MASHEPELTQPQVVMHYATGPNGEWYVEAGAHPGSREDCARCSTGGER